MGRKAVLTMQDRFLSHVREGPAWTDRHGNVTCCLLWTGARSRLGYGRFTVDGSRKAVEAHRAAWEIFVGPLPKGVQVRRVCGNRDCVGPEHLRLRGVH